VKGAVVRGLATQIKRHFLWPIAVGHVPVKAQVLEAERALREPEVFGHTLDQTRSIASLLAGSRCHAAGACAVGRAPFRTVGC